MVQQHSIPDTPNNTDPVLMEFLRDKVNSFVRWDLIRFFHHNPHAVETAENVARYTGRDVRTVERELNGLAEAKIVRMRQAGAVCVYSLTPDATVRDLVARFVRACDDRQFREQVIKQVVHSMR